MSKLSLRNKILLPTIAVILVIGATAAITTSVMFKNLQDRQFESVQVAFQRGLNEKRNTIIGNYQQLKAAIEEKALEEAALFSKLPFIEQAYRLALSGNIDDERDAKGRQAREMLRKEMAPFLEGYSLQTQRQFQIHYHLPNAHSLARLWRDGWQTMRDGKRVDISDDLSSFRDSVIEVNKNKKTVTGIEVGSGGFVVRALCPVLAEDGTHLGSNEVISEFLPIVEALKTSEHQLFAVLMDVAHLNQATALRDQRKFPILGDKYVLCAATDMKSAGHLLDKKIRLLDRGRQDIESELSGSQFISAFPIEDFRGAPVGVFISVLDVEDEQLALEANRSRMHRTFQRLQYGVIIGTILVILTVGAVIWLIVRSITKPINRIIESLATGADQVSAASSQVSAASQSLAQGASEQAAAIEETSSSLEEMSSMTRQSAENAAQANGLMREANAVVDKAGLSMKEMSQSMGEISAAGREINKIIKTIDEIAFQTNLLALNAAVEAARAGEAGAGFAVVADEVRNLAQRATDAAGNTADLIEGTISRIDQGAQLVKSTDDAFSDVAASSAKVTKLINEIAAASTEQAQGIDHVNQAVSQMDHATQTNAAGAEESAGASEELNTQAENMLNVVHELMTLVGGAGTVAKTREIRPVGQDRRSRRRPLSLP
jgi:methyl-accepting chemotaxis protein